MYVGETKSKTACRRNDVQTKCSDSLGSSMFLCKLTLWFKKPEMCAQIQCSLQTHTHTHTHTHTQTHRHTHTHTHTQMHTFIRQRHVTQHTFNNGRAWACYGVWWRCLAGCWEYVENMLYAIGSWVCSDWLRAFRWFGEPCNQGVRAWLVERGGILL